jgi:hypothetical protein
MGDFFRGHASVGHPAGGSSDSWFAYTCGHCSAKVAGAVVSAIRLANGELIQWLWCPNCDDGSVAPTDGNVYPAVASGPVIEGLPNVIQDAYQEARRCMSVNAYTASELMCRKLLMHMAVDKGAKEGLNFTDYLAHLERVWKRVILTCGDRGVRWR